MVTYCKADFGLQGCRQIAISISHKFMAVGFIYVDTTEDNVDSYAGHSAAVARQNYDQVRNALKQETQTRRDRMMNREWWSILGLTDKPPPKPRLTSYESTLPDEDTSTKEMQRQIAVMSKELQANSAMLAKLISAVDNLKQQDRTVDVSSALSV